MTHLCGSIRRGGHELSDADAQQVVDSIDAGTSPPNVVPQTRQRRARTSTSSQTGSFSPLTKGHWRSLDLLRDSDAICTTIGLYRRAIGADVYLRPTAQGLIVISLDWRSCASMIGVGGRSTRDHILRSCPPSEAIVERAAAGYLEKRDTLDRRSDEERFVLRCIEHGLQNGLRLPGGKWTFVHQEWRMPTSAGGGKADLIAVDSDGRLVVIEAKQSERIAIGAEAEAARYAAWFHSHRTEIYPYLTELVRALSAVYAGDHSTTPEIDPARSPATAVWWPGNPIP